MKDFDVAVIGGGPAGSAAAITAARYGKSVLLLERASFPRPKVCGEFVSAEAVAVMEKLLGNDHALLLQSPTIHHGRLFLDGRVTPVSIHPRAHSIPRMQLDHALWQAAKVAGATCMTNTTVSTIDGTGPFELHSANGNFLTKAVINATGRWSELSSSPPPQGPKWIGLKAHFAEAAEISTSVDLYFFTGGYCGVQPVGDGKVNACAMVRADFATSLPEVFALHPGLHTRSIHWSPVTDVVSTAPLVHAAPQPVRGNILQVGDAAGFIDPFLGDGISLALHSGVLAAQSIQHNDLNGVIQRYSVQYQRLLAPAFVHAARLRKLLGAPVYIRRPLTGLLRVPGAPEWLLHQTRPRSFSRYD